VFGEWLLRNNFIVLKIQIEFLKILINQSLQSIEQSLMKQRSLL
jgi:hypothetical protein